MTFWTEIEAWNKAAFLFMNADAAASSPVLEFAKFTANWVVYLIPAMLVIFWLKAESTLRTALFMCLISALVALALNQVISVFWYHPRPFILGIGHSYLKHSAESSFPSDHFTFMAAITLGLWWWTSRRFITVVIAGLSILVAWSRIYIGVHFPLDMLGALAVAIGSIGLVAPLQSFIDQNVMPGIILPVHNRLFAIAIRKGWIN